ncbi:MAG: DNA translocase FtsK [Agathobacter sp.]|uniref:FtsK/SpoIIIE family DNA translocase n=1 Tax=Agathobacter sp. TaxID=2021311 RepID=UPI002584C008|nr:DNA translocase FtsK [Agathobacter sp.]MCR5677400.1 DNA translocase FtsK [Agathobacter sp.]
MATSRKSSGRKKSTRSKRAQNIEQQNNIRETVYLLIVLAIAILLALSNFGVGGTIGNSISDILFGIFGLFAFAFPIAIVYLTLSIINVLRGKSSFAIVKLIAAIFFVIFLCMFMTLAIYSGDVVKPVEAFKYSMNMHNGGGIIGGVAAYLIKPAFGLIGAYVLDVIILIICVVLIAERTPIVLMREKQEEFRENSIARREERRIEREERRNSRFSGVTVDTTLKKSLKKQKKSDAMQELLPQEDALDVPVIKNERKTALSSDGEEKLVTEKSFATPSQVDAQEVASELNISGDFTKDVQEPKKEKIKITKEEITEQVEQVSRVVANEEQFDYNDYEFPPKELLKPGSGRKAGNTESDLRKTATKLEQTLDIFGVKAKVENISCGPAVTRYELKPELGVKVSKIKNLEDDIKLSLAVTDIRMEAPIPGKAAIGIEVPNKENVMVPFREVVDAKEFESSKATLPFAVGKDIAGKIMVTDIAKMPHMLIAGSTGSGKSVCINTIIMSIIYKCNPEDVKMLMIDPKVVELSVYNGIPHLIIPVVTDPKKAAGALQWAVAEMTDRYQKFAETGCREIKGYNANRPEGEKKMPHIVVIVDELADLMMVASNDVEEAICRLAQLARAAGIHLIIATQRPSVDVITGLIKANMPSRVAFAVTSSVDSRTILDMGGAEKLLGKGDMLFYPQGLPKPVRVQGAFISDKEVEQVVQFLKDHNQHPGYNEDVQNKMESITASSNTTTVITGSETPDGGDPLFVDAARVIVDKEKASIGMLQRYLKVGFNRAARIMDELEEAGVVGPEMGTKPRTVLMSAEQFENWLEENG